MVPLPPRSTLFPYTTLFRSSRASGMSINGEGKLLAITLRSFGVHLFSTETGKRVAQLPLWPGESKTAVFTPRSEEHTSELQSQSNLVCRLLLEKKKKNKR